MTDTSDAVERFEPSHFDGHMLAAPRGAYVRYSDYAALRAERDRLQGCVSDLLALMPDDEGPEIDAARAELDASK